jgi:hypothetical protein
MHTKDKLAQALTEAGAPGSLRSSATRTRKLSENMAMTPPPILGKPTSI